jgi:Zn-dependent protease with chaperone function
MPFLLLLLLIVVYLPGKWPDPPTWLEARGSVLVTWLATAVSSAVAAFLAGLFRRQLFCHPEQRSRIVQRYARWRRSHFLGQLGVYLAALYALGWAGTVRSWGTVDGRTMPALEVIILAPFLTGLIFGWAFFYGVERDMHESGSSAAERTFPSRCSYLGMQIRHNFLLLFPPLLLMTLQQTVLWLAPALESHWLFKVASVGMLIAVFLTLPWMLIFVLGLKPLPPGPLRDRLLATAERLGLQCREVLLWNTRKGMANALVTGILPRLRYVVVSDRLVSDLTPEEVEAVFGHEAGHVKHHHLLYYLVFLLLSMVVVGSFWEAVSSLWAPTEPSDTSLAAVASETGMAVAAGVSQEEPESILTMLPMLAILTGYMVVVFGYLSRRCESQADVYGCRAVSCAQPFCVEHGDGTVLVPRGHGLCATGIRTFISALEKVACVNGISRRRAGLLHPSIAHRVEFLHSLQTNPELEPQFQRRLGLFKWGLLAVLGALMAVLVLVLASSGVGLERVLDSLLRL